MDWQQIDTAPKDGRTVHVRRVFEGRVVYDGPAQWRLHTREVLHDPRTGESFGEAGTSMEWKYPTDHKEARFCVPVPTEWKP